MEEGALDEEGSRVTSKRELCSICRRVKFVDKECVHCKSAQEKLRAAVPPPKGRRKVTK